MTNIFKINSETKGAKPFLYTVVISATILLFVIGVIKGVITFTPKDTRPFPLQIFSEFNAVLPNIIYQNYKGDTIIIPLDKKIPDNCQMFDKNGYHDCWSSYKPESHIAPNNNTEMLYSTTTNGIINRLVLKDVLTTQQIVTPVLIVGNNRDFTWSPDGRYISWTHIVSDPNIKDHTLYDDVIYLDITKSPLATSSIAHCSSYSWTLDAKHIICHDYFSNSISLVGISDPEHDVTNIQYPLSNSLKWCHSLAIAPDSKSFVCVTTGDTEKYGTWAQKITLYNLDSNLNINNSTILFNGPEVLTDQKVLVPIGSIISNLLYSTDSRYVLYFGSAPGVIDLETGKIYRRGPHQFESVSSSFGNSSPQWAVINNFRISIR